MNEALAVGIRHVPIPRATRVTTGIAAPIAATSPSFGPVSGLFVELDGSVLYDLALDLMAPTSLA